MIRPKCKRSAGAWDFPGSVLKPTACETLRRASGPPLAAGKSTKRCKTVNRLSRNESRGKIGRASLAAQPANELDAFELAFQGVDDVVLQQAFQFEVQRAERTRVAAPGFAGTRRRSITAACA